MARRALVQRVHAPYWEPRQRRLIVEPLALFVGVATLAALFILFGLQLRGLAFAGTSLGVSASIAFVVFRTNRRVAEFDARFVPLLQREDIAGLQALLDDSVLVRALGPRGLLASRRGVLALLRRDDIEAERQLEIAWQRTVPEARNGLVAALCRVKYRTRKLTDMRELAEDWARLDRRGGPALWYLALGKLESEGLSDVELDDLVINAGPVDEPIDEEVRQHVYTHMSARGVRVNESPRHSVDEQPEHTQPTVAPLARFATETGDFVAADVSAESDRM